MILRIQKANTNYSIKWRITDKCNYRCSYCTRKQHNYKDLVETDLIANAKLINQFCDLKKTPLIDLQLLGGEPTILELDKILNELTSDNIDRIRLTTNLSKPYGYFFKLLSEIDKLNVRQFLITASYHEEFCNLNEFIEKCKILNMFKLSNNKRFKLKLDTVYTGKNKQDMLDFISNCEKFKLSYRVNNDVNQSNIPDDLSLEKPMSNEKLSYTVSYSNGFTENFKTKNDLITKLKINPLGYFCSASKNGLYIKDNDVYDVPAKCKHKLCDISELSNIQLKSKICEFTKCNFCGNFSISTTDNF